MKMGIKLTFYDKFFIIFVIFLSLLGFIVNSTFEAGAQHEYLTIQVEGEVFMEFSFDEGMEKKVEIPIGEGNGERAILEVKDGRARMLPISEELCPQGICTHTGWISRRYQSIVCVPNRIVVTFSDETTEDVDGITH